MHRCLIAGGLQTIVTPAPVNPAIGDSFTAAIDVKLPALPAPSMQLIDRSIGDD
jgi:hypothetical protein